MHYELEFEGGLGDVFYQMFHRGAYNILRDLEPTDEAAVTLICNNPFASELFAIHPKASQINIQSFEYWPITEDAEKRVEFNLPPVGRNFKLPEKDDAIIFYPSPSDQTALNSLTSTPYLVLSASAGLPYKNVPREAADAIIEIILDRTQFSIVVVGRTYSRTDVYGNNRFEYDPPCRPRVINLVDQLSVPGMAVLVQNSRGVITGHSACGILGWLLRKPQLLLYPNCHVDKFIKPTPRTLWAFGIDRYHTVHGTLEEDAKPLTNKFISRLTEPRTAFESECLAGSKSIYCGEDRMLSRILGNRMISSSAQDMSLTPHLAMSGFWESWVSVAIKSYLEPGMVAMDIGACFGYFTILMSDAVGPAGKVFSFEPDPYSFAFLQDTKVINGLLNVTNINKAVGFPGKAILNTKSNYRGVSSLVPMPPDWSQVEVDVVSPESVLAGVSRVDFIKVDVEGWEEPFWECSKTLRDLYQPTIAIEFSPLRYHDPSVFWDKIAAYSPPYVVDWDGLIRPAAKSAILNAKEDRMLWVYSPRKKVWEA